jgi:glycine cleavage system transcriptional repressor
MGKEYIITMTAANRVGILAAVTNAMAELGGDLIETRQTVVRGFFTMIFAAVFPDHREPDVILDHLRDVCRPFGIEVGLKDPTEEILPEASTNCDRVVVRLEGRNAPGLLHQIGKTISVAGSDIVNLRAVSSDDGRTFCASLHLDVSEETTYLFERLQELGRQCGFIPSIEALENVSPSRIAAK